jgi:hypothetical protein
MYTVSPKTALAALAPAAAVTAKRLAGHETQLARPSHASMSRLGARRSARTYCQPAGASHRGSGSMPDISIGGYTRWRTGQRLNRALAAVDRFGLKLAGYVEDQLHAAGDPQLVEDPEHVVLHSMFAEV